MPKGIKKNEHWTAAVRRIRKNLGCSQEEALKVYKANGSATAVTPKPATEPRTEGMNAEAIAHATKARAEFLSNTITGLRESLEAYQEELGKLVEAGRALGLDLPAPGSW